LSRDGELRLGKKADIVLCLEDTITKEYRTPVPSAMVFDGSALVHMLKPEPSSTFKDYADVFARYILAQIQQVEA